MALHLVTFALMVGFYSWAVWLANSRPRPARTGGTQTFKAVMPYRVAALLTSPFFLWASWHEWGKAMGIIFLIVAVGCGPLAACLVTLRVSLDDEAIRIQHLLADKRLRYDQIAGARLREWTGEYIVRGKDGTKIVFPTWLENAAYVFGRCQRNGRVDDETEGASDNAA